MKDKDIILIYYTVCDDVTFWKFTKNMTTGEEVGEEITQEEYEQARNLQNDYTNWT